MTTQEQAAINLVLDLFGRGFTLWRAGDKVMVKPAKELAPQDAEAIKANKVALLALLCPLTDEQMDAVAERAYEDPPDFGEGNTVLRESVLVDVFDEWWAFSPEAIKEADQMAKVARERKAKEQGGGKGRGKGSKRGAQGHLSPDD